MSIAALLAVVDGGDASSATMRAAVALGQRFEAYVEALHVRLDPENSIPLVGEGMSAAMVEQVSNDLRQSAERHASAARAAAEEACRSTDTPLKAADGAAEANKFVCAWRELVGREDAAVGERALLFDLVVCGRPDEAQEGAYAPALEAAMFEAGRPVLVMPPAFEGGIGKKVVVGWAGTRECARAVTGALPLLAGASEVQVVSLVDEGEELEGAKAPEAAAAWLALHGVQARARKLPSADGAGEALMTAAGEAGADLLVMGAYGHSRLREFVLGGATRAVLTHCALPVLMAH
jgi:nucleotide-binding universal stress UspA family protein